MLIFQNKELPSGMLLTMFLVSYEVEILEVLMKLGDKKKTTALRCILPAAVCPM